MSKTQIRGTQIFDNDITSNDLANGAVRGSSGNAGSQRELLQGSVSTVDLRDDSVDATKLLETDSYAMDSLSINSATGTSLVVDTNVLVVDATANMVGIGTSSPSRALDIAGAIHLRDYGTGIEFTDPTASSSKYFLFLNNDDSLHFYNNNALDVLTLLQAGNVGIGTATPTSLLHILNASPSFTFQKTGGARQLDLSFSGPNPLFKIQDDGGGDSYIEIDYLGFRGYRDGSPESILNTAGGLILQGPGGTGVSLSDDDDGNGTLSLRTNGSQTIKLTGLDSTHSFINVPNANFGIGTGSPQNKLHVVDGSIKVDNTSNGDPFLVLRSPSGGQLGLQIINPSESVTGDSFIWMTNHTNSNNYIYMSNNPGSQEWIFGRDGSNNKFKIGTGSTFGAPKLTIQSTGEVGVGTQAPQRTFDVHGDIRVFTLNSGIEFFDNTADPLAGNTNGWFQLLNTNGSLSFYNNTIASNAVTFLQSGNIGINTDTPLAKLHIGNVTDASALQIGNNGSDDFVFYSDVNGSGGLQIQKADGTKIMMINVGGNVGIGTSSPGARLHIAKSGQTLFRVQDTLHSVTFQTTVGNSTVQIGSTTNHAVDFVQGGGRRLTFTTAGTVGVKTFTPGSTFSILGSSSIGTTYSQLAAPGDGLLVEGHTGIGTSTPTSLLHVFGSFARKTATITSTPYAPTTTDSILLVDATAGATTIDLPDATTCTDRIYDIKKIDSTGNAVTIDANGTQTIDGALTAVISTQYASFTLVSDGSNWNIL